MLLTKPIVSMIAAIGSRNRVIGRNNKLPWSKHLGPDMRRFTKLTMGHPVIMGRNTWESLPIRFRPLADRTNIVVTSKQGSHVLGAHTAYSLYGALQYAEHFPGSEEIFIIGGQQIYTHAVTVADRLYLTLVDEDAEGDTFFPQYSHLFDEVACEVEPGFEPRLTYVTLERRRQKDRQ